MFKDNFTGSGFGGLAPCAPDFDDVSAAILPVPYDGAVSYKTGAREGPGAIIEASAQVELFDPLWGVDCENLRLATLNNLEPDVTGPEETIKKTAGVYAEAVDRAGFVLMLGGDHSLATAPVSVLARRHHGALTVVQFDAHADLRNTYQGSAYSHACVMRRIIEMAPVVQVGVRNISRQEDQFMRRSGHPVFTAWDIHRKTGWLPSLIDSLKENVYITFDLDCFDPSVVPGVGTPEPGGLRWQDVIDAIRQIGLNRRIVGADVMELRPIPGCVQSEFASARLCFKLLSAALLLKGNL